MDWNPSWWNSWRNSYCDSIRNVCFVFYWISANVPPRIPPRLSPWILSEIFISIRSDIVVKFFQTNLLWYFSRNGIPSDNSAKIHQICLELFTRQLCWYYSRNPSVTSFKNPLEISIRISSDIFFGIFLVSFCCETFTSISWDFFRNSCW